MPEPPDKPSPPSFEDLFGNFTDEQKAAFAELIYPGAAVAWQRIVDDVKIYFDVNAARAGEPVVLAAMRVMQAVGVAARRKDKAALQAWENLTLDYMEENALDEYLAISLPPRATTGRQAHDRHLILSALRASVSKYLHEHKPFMQPTNGLLEGMINNVAIWMRLQNMVQMTFPHLSDDNAPKTLLADRITAHTKTGRPMSEIDPEEVILDGLRMLGVPRPVAQNWLKGAAK